MKQWASVALVVFIVVVAGGALMLGLSGSQSAVSGCKSSSQPVTYGAVIQNNTVTVYDHVSAKRCDKLMITNKDNTAREIAFGLHSHHEAYDGVTERVLGKDDSFTVTLNQTGSFRWHDHLHDEIQGFFTVAN